MIDSTPRRLVLVGNPEEVHIGRHFLSAAASVGIHAQLCDVRQAYGSGWKARWDWRMRDHRPLHVDKFSSEVERVCSTFQPHWILGVGLVPLTRSSLDRIGQQGVQRLNYLTDDPWNPIHRSSWFSGALPAYDGVFTTKRATAGDLKHAGVPFVEYLPFAYAPEIHFPERAQEAQERCALASDILFVGGADPDRVLFVRQLIRAGFQVALYGGYWDRYRDVRKFYRGFADPPVFRKAVAEAKTALCLVRRANRDDHSMRSFEMPAMRCCLLTEDTEEHRNIFGADGEAVVYFRTIPDILSKLRWLLEHDQDRRRLAETAHRRITQGKNTYADRLDVMLTKIKPGQTG